MRGDNVGRVDKWFDVYVYEGSFLGFDFGEVVGEEVEVDGEDVDVGYY